MSTAWSPPRTAAELPDDDHEAAYVLTGGLYDGCEIGRRERKLWPKRNCPPSVKRDPEMTARFRAAVLRHDQTLNQIMKDIEDGKLRLDQIADEDIIGGLAALAKDPRRPSVQLQAWKTLAEMRGLIRNAEAGAPLGDEQLERLLEEREARLAERQAAPEQSAARDPEPSRSLRSLPVGPGASPFGSVPPEAQASGL